MPRITHMNLDEVLQSGKSLRDLITESTVREDAQAIARKYSEQEISSVLKVLKAMSRCTKNKTRSPRTKA